MRRLHYVLENWQTSPHIHPSTISFLHFHCSHVRSVRGYAVKPECAPDFDLRSETRCVSMYSVLFEKTKGFYFLS